MTAATPHRRPSSDEFKEFMDFLEGDERPSVNNDGDDESSITSNGGDLSKSSSRFGGPSRRVSFSSGIMLQAPPTPPTPAFPKAIWIQNFQNLQNLHFSGRQSGSRTGSQIP